MGKPLILAFLNLDKPSDSNRIEGQRGSAEFTWAQLEEDFGRYGVGANQVCLQPFRRAYPVCIPMSRIDANDGFRRKFKFF